jgi:5-dehydro-2-deoxygluconokinase
LDDEARRDRVAAVVSRRGEVIAMRELDLICLGRAAVDLYGEQIGSPLESMQSFAMSLGGCAANIAVGSSRLGLKVAMLTRVGDEHMGRFVRDELARQGVDVSHVKTDPSRLTGLVILGIRDRETFPLIFYRVDCADMAIEPGDFDRELIARAKALLVIGTHFSKESTAKTCRQAIAWAKESGTKVIFDIDYRPVLWGLTGHGRGEDRYVKSDHVSAHLQSIISECDLIVGTEEEIHIAGGTEDTIAALRQLRSLTTGAIVLKRGRLGCAVFDGPIPDRVEEGFVQKGVPVEVLNVLGAGDAFMSGFLRGWLRDEGLDRATKYANAAGALVVSRHGCAPAMPTEEEMFAYLAREGSIRRIDLDPEIAHLHRVTTRDRGSKELAVLAFDHRVQLEAMAKAAGADLSRLRKLKTLIAEAAWRCAEESRASDGLGFGVIIDDDHGRDALLSMTGRGLWIARPIEKAGATDLTFVGGPDVGLTLKSWPKDHVIKCLSSYHPGTEAGRREREEHALLALLHSAIATGHELLLEIIPRSAGAIDSAAVVPAIERLYSIGVRPDWWKLQPPKDASEWSRISAAIEAGDRHCRGVLLLGLDAPETEVHAGFARAAGVPVARGFAVGRTIFAEPSEAWLAGTITDEMLTEEIAGRFRRTIEAWRNRASSSK